MATPDLLELDNSPRSAFDFRKAILDSKKDNPVAASVYAYSVPDYQKMKLFLTEDRKAGVAVKPNGDIVSVFNAKDSPNRGVSHMLMEVAIANGGRKLDCFDTVLPEIYSGHGFRTITRQHWNDEYSPEGWDKERFQKFNNGEPDVVYMVYDQSYYGEYKPADGSLETDYDEAVRKQEEAVRELNPEKTPPEPHRMASKKDSSGKKKAAKPESSYRKWQKVKSDLGKKLEEKRLAKKAEAYRKQQKSEQEGFVRVKEATATEKHLEGLVKKFPLSEDNKLRLNKVLAYISKWARAFKDNFLTFTYDLTQEMDSYGIHAAKDWLNTVTSWSKRRSELLGEAGQYFKIFEGLSKEEKAKVESLLFDSTTSGKWAFDVGNWEHEDGLAVNATRKNKKGEVISNPTYEVDDALAKRFNNLSAEGQAVVRGVFENGFERLKQKRAAIRKEAEAMDIKPKLRPISQILPYAPLIRTGRYNVVWRSKELREELGRLETLRKDKAAFEEEQAKKDEKERQEYPKVKQKALELQAELVERLKQDENHYVVSRFDSLSEAMDLEHELNKREANNPALRVDLGNNDKTSLTSHAELNELASNMKSKIEERFHKSLAQSLMEEINEMLLDANQSKVDSLVRKRRNIAGANPHMMDTFMRHANTDAWMLSNFEYGKQMSDDIVRARDQVKEMEKEGRDSLRYTEAQSMFNELEKRYNYLTRKESHTAFDEVLEGGRMFNTFSMLSLKPSFYMQNGLQPIMMTLPYLSGEFGFGKSLTYMRRSYGEWQKLFSSAMETKKGETPKSLADKWRIFSNLADALETFKYASSDEKVMLKEMQQRNLLDLGAQSDFGEFKGNSKLLKFANKGMNAIGVAARGVELINRYVSATAAFRLKRESLLKKGMTKEQIAEVNRQATEYAADVLARTQGDYSGPNASSAFNTKPGKLALPFRKFQAIQLNYFLNLCKKSLPSNMDGDEKKIARYQLASALAVHFAFAGITGLPGMTLAMAVAGMALGDDGEEGEDTVRRILGEMGMSSDVQDIFMEGTPTILGANLSDSVGAGQMFSPVPYTRKGLTEEGGMMEMLFSAFGGPLASRLVRLHTGGVQSMESQNVRPFLEAALPAGLPQLMKALNIMDPTVDERTGEKFLSDDDFHWGHRFLQALSLTPTPLQRMYDMRNHKYRLEQKYKKETAEFKRRFIEAAENKDYREQTQILKELSEYNKRRKAHGFATPVKPQDLRRAVKERRDNERRQQQFGGLKVRKNQTGMGAYLNEIHNKQ